MKISKLLIGMLFSLLLFQGCGNDDEHLPDEEEPAWDMTGFAKGADVSWLTEMEKAGKTFTDASGQQMECMELLRDLGMNSVRLRVWVNPSGGWCNKGDVLVKALRANRLNMRIMVDFHYSDVWADPGNQTKPAAWQDLSFNDLKTALAAHTEDVLSTLKDNGITPEWVQAGNETGNGMLWEDGRASQNMKNYAELNNAGYDAVKKVFPQAKVIVHLQNGDDNDLYRWLFDGLKENGGKWDVIGMSLYPQQTTWRQMNTACISNVNDMISRYGCETMICEVGMPWDEAEACYSFLSDLIRRAKAVSADKCLGVFYWEPQSYSNWNNYTLGAFDNNGKPTKALDAFKE